MTAAAKTRAASNATEFVISRVVDAPRDLVWKAFTEAERLKQWWGPKAFKVIASKIDLRVGGTYHYGLQAPDGAPVWGKFVFREVTPQDRLVFVQSFSDEAGGVTRHPMAPTWPLYMLATFTFEDQPGGKTRFTVHWTPHEATPEEQAVFDGAHASMQQGWGGTLEKLEQYVATAKA
jgi:uncharacterized protein YndB with AHSA1/START domain